MISSICSEQPHRVAQFEQLDGTNLSSSSTENTAITTSENTSPQSEEREQEKLDKAVVARSRSSLSVKNKLVGDERIDFDLDLPSAPASRTQNDSDGLPCKESPATKSDSSTSVRPFAAEQVECLPQLTPANQLSKPNSEHTDEAAMQSPALESPARTQLLTRLSALTNESVDSLRLNNILNSALDRYSDMVTDALEYFQQASTLDFRLIGKERGVSA